MQRREHALNEKRRRLGKTRVVPPRAFRKRLAKHDHGIEPLDEMDPDGVIAATEHLAFSPDHHDEHEVEVSAAEKERREFFERLA
jgi:hypothetical protein